LDGWLRYNALCFPTGRWQHETYKVRKMQRIIIGWTLTAEQVADKTNNMPRRSIPISGNHLTAFIDVQGKLLLYVVVAREDGYTGYVVDYGTYPDQQQSYFTLLDARHALGNASEGSIYVGLETLTNDLLGRKCQRDDGAALEERAVSY